MYLYIKLRSVTLFSKFIFNSESFKMAWNLNTQGMRVPRKKCKLRNVRQWTNQLFKKFLTEIAGGCEVHDKKRSYIDVRR